MCEVVCVLVRNVHILATSDGTSPDPKRYVGLTAGSLVDGLAKAPTAHVRRCSSPLLRPVVLSAEIHCAQFSIPAERVAVENAAQR